MIGETVCRGAPTTAHSAGGTAWAMPAVPRCSRPVGACWACTATASATVRFWGPPEVHAAPTMTIVVGQRYLCTAYGAVVMVVPRGIEPRRHYWRAAICLALALWALAGQPTTVVRSVSARGPAVKRRTGAP